MKLEKLIRRQEPFKKGSITGYINDLYNYCIFVCKILILQLTKSGLIVWFDNRYYSKIVSKVQNVICKMVGLPKKRGNDNISNLPKIKEEKDERTK